MVANFFAGVMPPMEDTRQRTKSMSRSLISGRYSNGWVKTADGKWASLAKARFTADANPVVNINASVKDGLFTLGTGGALENKDTPLGKTMDRPAGTEPPALPK